MWRAWSRGARAIAAHACDLDALDDALKAVEEEPVAPSTEPASDLGEATDGVWEAEDEADDDGWDVDW